ncbi:MAG TPA: linear amide C-N hydrolase [Verrucomicrobiae bacterium]|nr:linear amide C-N hydrolase [Verrucomicrobiae bacterium]
MRNLNTMLTATILFVLVHQCAEACTGFAMKDGKRVLVGLSYDQQFGAGHIYVNQRNMERRRYQLYAEKPASWVSKYENITFNLAGMNFPHDGMNEAGLVVLSMGLDGTRFPGPDSRSAIDELGWIQYQLDTAASVDEVIQSMKTLRISSRGIGDCHYLIVDSSGKAVVIEYPGGQTKVYTGDTLPYVILANDAYPHMLAYLKQQKVFGGPNEDKHRVGSSCSRFTEVANRVRNYNPTNAPMMDYAFDILREVRQSNSRYQVVYDIMNRSIHYRSFNSTEVKTIRFSEMDFDRAAPALMTEIQSSNQGNMEKRFHVYDANRSREALVEFNKQTLGYLPMETLASLAETTCQPRCLTNAPQALVSGTKEPCKADTLSGDLVASLKPPTESRIVVSNGADNIVLDFAVTLNRAATADLDFAFEVPYDSALVPGDNVFIAPNPVRIERGNDSVSVKAIVIADRVKAGVDARLIVNLLSQEAALGNVQRLTILVRRETASK